ncbi:MAG: sulfatase family protein [Flavicella sp.]
MKLQLIKSIILLVCCNWIISCNAQDTQKPNILFILSEDMSTDLACYGMQAVKTPVLDELAATGIQYMNAFGTNSICSPSRSNMMTGVHQNRINAQHHRSNRKIPLMAPYKPITSYLREAGYTCIIGNKKINRTSKKIDVNFKHNMLGPWDGTKQFGLFDKKDNIEVSDQPFFAQVTLNVTHRGDWWNNTRNNSTHKVNPEEVVLPPHYADTPEIRMDWAKYLDQVEKMDEQVGILLDELENKGMRENTIVIFMADNGRCNVRGKGYLYDPGLRLPLLVNWPAKISGGKKDERLVASVDVAATILETAGIELPSYMTAKSILSTSDKERTYVYSARDLWDEVLEQSRAISTKKYRYIKNNIPTKSLDAHQAYLEFHRPAVHVMRTLYKDDKLSPLQAHFFLPTKEKEELYDIVNDPFEEHNLIDDPKYKKVLLDMKSYYADWQQHNHDYGFEPIVWKNCPPPKAPKMIEWIHKERPDIVKLMQNGKQPNFHKLGKQFKAYVKAKKQLQ